MLGIDRKAARVVWTAALVVLLLWLVYLVRSTLFIFTLALLFAYLLSPLVNLLVRFLPRGGTRTAALAMAYVIFVAVVAVLSIQIGARVVEQANGLAKRFPAIIANWDQPSPGSSSTVNWIKEQVGAEIEKRSASLIEVLPQASLKFLAAASDLVFVVVIPILAFFFLKDGHTISQHVLSMVDDGRRRAQLEDLLGDFHLLLAHYMRALVGLSMAAFAAYGIFFSIAGVPYALLLAALGGLLECIPMIGPVAAGVLIVILTAVTGGHVAAVVIFLLAYRVVQDYVISPHLMGRGVELHPLLVVFGVFAGAEVAGIPGSFLSVPVLALARIVYLSIRKVRAEARLSPEGIGR